MASFLLISSACGAALGLLHARNLYRQIAVRGQTKILTGVNLRGLYYGIWTVALWTIFGSYVVVLWLIGAFATAIVGMNSKQAPT